MKILCVGDVCGTVGCETVQKLLPEIKRQNKIDLTIINGENSADGNGILPKSAELLFASGADVITGGNHSFRRKEIFDSFEENPFLLRPANYPTGIAGKGVCTVDFGKVRVAVINLSGQVYLEALECPFKTADKIITELKAKGIKNIIVDFHAEATSEKRAIGFFLDGKVSAVFGTHTHVQTADNQVLNGGTGYITDIGMTGPKNSVLGVKKEIIIDKFINKICDKFVIETNSPMMLNGCIFEIDELTGICKNTQLINIEI